MDEPPEIFARCTPRGAPAALRTRTLAAIDRQLARRRKLRWERAIELSIAASLALGIGLNTWLWRTGESASIGFGERVPSAAARDVAQAVASAAGPAAGRWVENELARAELHKRRGAVDGQRYQRLLHELTQGRLPESL
jgi:hypothetical protein